MSVAISRRELIRVAAAGSFGAFSFVHLSKAAPAGDWPGPGLAGRWVNGPNNGVCYITHEGGEIQLQNENGEAVIASHAGGRRIASRWGEVHADALSYAIRWPAGPWIRMPSLSGRWINSANGGICKVIDNDVSLELTNEDGQKTNGRFADGCLLKTDWGEVWVESLGRVLDWPAGPWIRMPSLQGLWVNAQNGGVCRVEEPDGRTIRFTNENGQSTEGRFVSGAYIRTGWGRDVWVEALGRALDWEAGPWIKMPSLEGTWLNAANSGVCRVQQNGSQITFTNENNQQTQGTQRGLTVTTPWGDALVHESGRSIDWPAGPWVPVKLNGFWRINNQLCSVRQNDESFLLCNEFGNVSVGQLTQPNQVSAWDSAATVTPEKLSWANGQAWDRAQVGHLQRNPRTDTAYVSVTVDGSVDSMLVTGQIPACDVDKIRVAATACVAYARQTSLLIASAELAVAQPILGTIAFLFVFGLRTWNAVTCATEVGNLVKSRCGLPTDGGLPGSLQQQHEHGAPRSGEGGRSERPDRSSPDHDRPDSGGGETPHLGVIRLL